MKRSSSFFCRLLACAVFLTLSMTAFGQVPRLDFTGLPAEPLIGETFCATLEFTNESGAEGYGPYIFVTVPPEVEVTSSSFLDIEPDIEVVGVIDETGMIADPISGKIVSGDPGGRASLIRIPVGSVLVGQPALVVESCGVVLEGAEVGVPLFLEFLPGFEFGDTPTGEGDPITGTEIQSGTVTPQLARIDKDSNVAEGERPPGPSHTFQYSYTVDVSEGVTIQNLNLVDDLPLDLQWNGSAISVTALDGALCRVIQEPNTPDVGPGGTLEVGCFALTGTTAEADLLVTMPTYIVDVLDETIADSKPVPNTVNIEYKYNDEIFNRDDTEIVTAVHVEAYKSASPETVVPGDIVTFAVNFSVTDYSEGEGLSSLILDDILSDGLEFLDNSELTVNGSSIPVNAEVNPNPPPAEPVGPGETAVRWNIGASVGTDIPVASRGRLTYQARVLQEFEDGQPVVAGDPLGNRIDLAYTHTEGADDSNGSNSGVTIEETRSDKTIIAPNPLPERLQPGEEITFRLLMDIPSGDTFDVRMTDYLPLPVILVADIVPGEDVSIPPAPFLQIDPAVSTDQATNSISFDFGDISSDTAEQIAVDLTVRITDQPFSDGLFLTNILQAESTDSAGNVKQDLHAVEFNVGAPELALTKGVFAVDNPAAVIDPPAPVDPSQELVDSNAEGLDAFDVVDYVITLENLGSKPAYNITLTDPEVAGLNCAPLDDSDVTNGVGETLSFSGTDLQSGIVVDGPIQGNDLVPGGGGAPFTRDTLLVRQRCTLDVSVEPGSVLVNTASATYTSTADSDNFFPSVTDDATVSTTLPTIEKDLVSVTPGYSPLQNRAHIGEIITYRVTVTVPEGTMRGARLRDDLDRGLAFVGIDDSGNAELVSINTSAGLSTSVAGGFETGVVGNAQTTNKSDGDEDLDRRLRIGPGNNDNGFGDITNSNMDNDTVETIELTYRARVLNWSGNKRGNARNNTATWSWSQGSDRPEITANAADITIIEPRLVVDKKFIPGSADRGSPSTIRVRVQHAGNSDGDAYQVELQDPLPFTLELDFTTLRTINCNLEPDVLSQQVRSFVAQWDVFPMGSDCTVEVATTGNPPLPAGFQVENCGEAAWESMDDADLPLAMPQSNLLGVQRTGRTADPGGVANNYNDQDCALLKIFDVTIAKEVESSSQDHTTAAGGVERLTIGEEVTFRLTATLPEGLTTGLIIRDEMPDSDMLIEAISAEVLPLPATSNLTIPNFPPTPVFEDRRGLDGFDDTVTFTFGSPIQNAPDSQVNGDDRIELLVTGIVRNDPTNFDEQEDENVALVQFGEGLNGFDQAALEIVEPALIVTKVGSPTTAEAGDTVTYTVRVSHQSGSSADAFDVIFFDLIPEDTILDAGSLRVADDCNLQPDAAPSTDGTSVSASWSAFPLGSSCDIVFDVEITQDIVSGSRIVNEADIEWRSLDDTAPSDEQERVYGDFARFQITVGDAGLEKLLVDTNIPQTGGNLLTIGEEATFEISVFFAEGTTADTRLSDQLPFQDGRLRLLSSRVVSIGGDINFSENVGVGTPGDDCGDCSAGGQGYADQAQWYLGDVLNLPDGIFDFFDPSGKVVFEVRAIVVDDPINQGQPAGPDFHYNEVDLVAENQRSADLEPISLVEPSLSLAHTFVGSGNVANVVAGQDLQVELVIDHRSRSSAPAFDLEIEYTLDPSVEWQGAPEVNSTCEGLVTDDSALPIVVFSFDELSLQQQECIILFPVKMDSELGVPGVYRDFSRLGYESAPGSAESRVSTELAAATYLAPADIVASKSAVTTSVRATGLEQFNPLQLDLTIGERVTYRIIAGLAEGSVDNFRIIDELPNTPNGRALLDSARIDFIGDGITTTKSGEPTIVDNVVTFDFGTVVNPADDSSDDNDTIVVEVSVVVINDSDDPPANVAGDEISNNAQVLFDGGDALVSATIDVVEPEPVLTKSFGAVMDNVVEITLKLDNAGSGPAFDALIEDAFDENSWEPLSMEPVFVPEQWTLNQASAGGFTTVSAAPRGFGLLPTEQEIIGPGDSREFIFRMTLKEPAPLTSIPNTATAVVNSLSSRSEGGRSYETDGSDTLLLPALVAEKTWSGASAPVAIPGERLTYTITVFNQGDGEATEVLVTDMPDARGQFQAGSVVANGGTVLSGNIPGDVAIEVRFDAIAGNSSASLSYEVLVPAPWPAVTEQEFVNLADISFKEGSSFKSDDDLLSGPDENPTVVPIVADPVMQVIKTDVPAVIGAGGVIYYQLDYANVGDQDATGVVITETVPDNTLFSQADSSLGWTCADSSPPGTICTFDVGDLGGSAGNQLTFAVRVDNPLPVDVFQIDNTVGITDDGSNSDNGQPSTDQDDEVTPIVAAPVLEITKDDGGISAMPGDIVVYTLNYENRGTRDAQGVLVRDTVPPFSVFDAAASLPDVWSCADGSPPLTVCELEVGDLPAGDSGVATFAMRIVNPLPAGVEQTTNVSLITDDGNSTLGIPIFNFGTDTTPIVAQPDLVIDKDDGDVTAQPGVVLKYTLNYNNVGNQDATGVLLSETVPVGTTYAANGSFPDSWSCVDGSPAGTVCEFVVGELAAGAGASASFGVLVDNPLPEAQSKITNTAVVTDDGSNGPDPTPGNNTDTIDTLFERSPSEVVMNKAVASSTQAHTGPFEGRENLTIGEEATFVLTATLPEGTTTALVIEDTLPHAAMVMEVISAEVIPLPAGSNLLFPAFPPVPVFEDRFLGDGLNDTVVFDFGLNVDNVPDGIEDERDQVQVLVTGRVKDLGINASDAEDANTTTVQMSDGLSGFDASELRLVEPRLSLVKIGDQTAVEAGVIINFDLVVEHRGDSTADAFDLVLLDTLPNELNYVDGSFSFNDTCSDVPDLGPSVTGKQISFGWVRFPLGAACTIRFQAEVNLSAVSGSRFLNRSTLEWFSLDDTVDNEDERRYFDRGVWPMVVTDPGLEKTLVSSSIDRTSDNRLTIGEEVTFEIIADFPNGQTLDVVVSDQLPYVNGRLEVVSSRITSIGPDMVLSSGAQVGDPGEDCQPNCSTGGFGYDDLVQWNLGDVLNITRDVGDNPQDQVIFEVVAVVKDLPENQGIPAVLDFLFNEARLTARNQLRFDLEPLSLVEPRLALTHDIVGNSPWAVVRAGEILEIELQVSHLGNSSAAAYDLFLDYTLDPDVLWVGDETVTSDCADLVVDSSDPALPTFSFPELPLLQRECTIGFQVQMSPTLPVPGVYRDRSMLAWESAPKATESRPGMDSASVIYLAPGDGTFAKEIRSTSLPETGSLLGNDPLLTDVAIGELITYRLIGAFAEGTTDPVIMVDTVQQSPAGTLQVEAASIEFIGRNITTGLPGLPVISGNTVTFDFGAVANEADGLADDGDLIIANVTARVTDLPSNSRGGNLDNGAVMTFGNQSAEDGQTVEIVEPTLGVVKDFTGLENGRAEISVTISNSGNAPAYSLVMIDEFDETIWLKESMEPVDVPEGWELTQTSVNNTTIVRMALEGGNQQPEPDQILLPGGSRTVVFSMELVVPVTQPSVQNVADGFVDSLPGDDENARPYTDSGGANVAGLALPVLDLLKPWSGPNNPALPGDVLTYTLELTNDGDGDATNVVLSDMPDTLGEFQAGSVTTTAGTVVVGNDPGQTMIVVEIPLVESRSSVIVTYQVVVPAPYPAATTKQFENHASLMSTELAEIRSDDPATGVGDDDPTIVPILAAPVLEIIKDDIADVVGAGGTVYYQLDYQNSGNQDTVNVAITETVPLNTTYNATGSLPDVWSCADGSGPGTVCTYQVGELGGSESGSAVFAVRVDNPLPDGVTQIQNTAQVSDDGSSTNGQPLIDEDSDTTLVAAVPVLEISKDDGGITVMPGDIIVYQLDFVNNGTQEATGVFIRDLVPPGTVFDAASSLPDVWSCADGSPALTVCELTVGDLAGQGQGTGQARFAVRVNNPLAAGIDQANNLVSIRDDGNNAALLPVIDFGFDSTPIDAQPDLVITKDDGGIIGFPGQVFSYELLYRNEGNQGASGVVITETVPVGMTYAASGSGTSSWSCPDVSPAGTVCTLIVGDLDVAEEGSALFGARVDDPLPAGQAEVINTVVIADDGLNGTDPTPDNNTDTISTLVTLFPPAGRKTVKDLGGGQLQWTMTWFNNKNVTVLPVLVLDPIPDRATYIAGSLVCTATGDSVCLSAVYQSDEDRIWVEAEIAEDFGAPDGTPDVLLDNEISISFRTTSITASAFITNVGESCWDYNNTGSAIDDWEGGQVCIPVTASSAVAVPVPVNSVWVRALLILLILSLAWFTFMSHRARID